jgi:predicted GNAT family acetyltransferase
MAEITVRPARPADADGIIAFQLAMADESEGLALGRDTVTQGVHAVFADPAKGTYWVAEAEGRVIASLLTTHEWSDWRNGTVLWIQSVYVVPEARRKGVYRRLYEHLQRLVLSSPELKGLRLYVDLRNTAARAVYARLGMDADHYAVCEWLK